MMGDSHKKTFWDWTEWLSEIMGMDEEAAMFDLLDTYFSSYDLWEDVDGVSIFWKLENKEKIRIYKEYRDFMSRGKYYRFNY